MNWILDNLMIESTAFVEMDVRGGRRTEKRKWGGTDRRMKVPVNCSYLRQDRQKEANL